MRVLAIPDIHAPAEHPDCWEFLEYVRDFYRPNKVVCLGDELDAHTLSRWAKDPDLPAAGDELNKAIEHLQNLYKLFPNLLLAESNHTSRPYRLAKENGIPKALMRGYHEWLKAPKGYKWAEHHEIDGVIYTHGDPYSGPNATKKLVELHGQSVVHGHVHSHAAVHAFPDRAGLVWGANAGCLINRHHPAFSYAKGTAKPWLGVALVDNGVPRLLPMLLDKKGRWVER